MHIKDAQGGHEFQLLEGGSRTAAARIIDHEGFCYRFIETASLGRVWGCTKKGCHGRVIQTDEVVQRINSDHSHCCSPDEAINCHIYDELLKHCSEDCHRTAGTILQEVLSRHPKRIRSNVVSFQKFTKRHLKLARLAKIKAMQRLNLDCKDLEDALAEEELTKAEKFNRSSLPSPNDVNQELTHYSFFEEGSKRHNWILFDGNGYSYFKRLATSVGTTWICTESRYKCYASAYQREGIFIRNAFRHAHEPAAGKKVHARILADLRKEIQHDSFSSAARLVANYFKKKNIDESMPGLPVKASFVSYVVRYRRLYLKKRVDHMLPEPEELVDDCEIPDDFFKEDLKGPEGSHRIFASQEQLSVLQMAQVWYMTTSRGQVLEKPFCQLLTIYAYVMNDKIPTLAPLMFVLMSGESDRNYKDVFKAIRGFLLENQCLEKVFANFDKAVWKAVSKVFKGVQVLAIPHCWEQEIRNLAAETGIAGESQSVEGIKNLVALPFIPRDCIAETFKTLKLSCSETSVRIYQAVEEKWMQDETWDSQDLSNYGFPVMSKADVQKWFCPLNLDKKGLKASMLPAILYKKASVVTEDTSYMTSSRVIRYHKKFSKGFHSKIYDLWKKLDSGLMNALEVLRKCSEIIAL